ncbi:hypothetical protein [Paraburkholderia heleia]|nr:hypothetical protein [Paraburkholderia heleia]
MTLTFLMGEERAGAPAWAQTKRVDQQFPFRTVGRRDGWQLRRYSKSG